MRVYSPYYTHGHFGFERLTDEEDIRLRPLTQDLPLHILLTRLLYESVHLPPCTPYPYPQPMTAEITR